MKVWREFLAFFDADKEGLSLEDFLDEHVSLIVLGFGREEVTKEVIDENVEVADIVPLTRALTELLEEVVRMLAHEEPLPAKYSDHARTGNYAGHRECHITPIGFLSTK